MADYKPGMLSALFSGEADTAVADLFKECQADSTFKPPTFKTNREIGLEAKEKVKAMKKAEKEKREVQGKKESRRERKAKLIKRNAKKQEKKAAHEEKMKETKDEKDVKNE